MQDRSTIKLINFVLFFSEVGGTSSSVLGGQGGGAAS